MLGFLYSRPGRFGHEVDPAPRFVSTFKLGARIPDFASTAPGFDFLVAWDCRHGRVAMIEIVVLCVVCGCDHRSCHAGPFKMVCVAVDMSVDGERWKEPCSGLDLAADAFIRHMPSVLVNDALHFKLGYQDDNDHVGILKYNLTSGSLPLIDVPLAARADIFMPMKDGSLGIAHVDSRLTLYVWSRQIDSNGVASWTHGRVVDLKNLTPIKNSRRPRLIGSVEGRDIIFVNTELGVYEIDLKTLMWKERMKGGNFHSSIPYMSFYNLLERVTLGDAAC
ncbi:hypothetical protein VPH35_069663 [Triticum aestivum]